MIELDNLVDEYKTPEGLANMIRDLDKITLDHSIRVCNISRLVEKELGFNDTILSESGLYHDIGKYYITPKILNKNCGLNDLEKYIIDTHAYLSYRILNYYNINRSIQLIALFHHKINNTTIDNIDESIIYKSIILKTIDIFEALTANRTYHLAISNNDAIDKIINSISQYDNDTINILKRYYA